MSKMGDKIIIRIQSPSGMKRIEILSSDNTCTLFEKIHQVCNLTGFAFLLYGDRGRKNEIFSSRSRTVASYNINHGDLLYLHPNNGGFYNDGPSTSGTLVTTPTSSSVAEDAVDVLLQREDGRIQRQRDEKLCRHGQNARCVHCSSLEPYDEKYLHEQNIKHLSFHSYLRKLMGGADRGKFVALENISCKIKPGCKEHSPWPKGICSKCQPNAVTLNRQVYRHVDNVMFENPQLVERFLDYWRTTGHQRVGYLYGLYEVHKDVPLGIKARVTAIYEPCQESSRDQVQLLPDEREHLVNKLAEFLGLQRVGWIFTDLVADEVKRGAVKHFRNVNSHFLSAQEVIMAGDFQNRHPSPCNMSSTGYFGSKFVTVCVTGDVENQVHMEGYQVSNQAMALVRDNCLVPTKDAPEMGYVKESSNEQYVPDVFYKEKDEYGNEVSQLARPLPIAYLLLDVPVSTPVEPQSTFYTSAAVTPFPVENRFIEGYVQDFQSLSSYLRQFPTDRFLDAASDFHFLIYIATMDTFPLKDYMSPLLEAVRTKDSRLACQWTRSEEWATVEQLIAAQAVSSSQAESFGVTSATAWTCIHCTYINQPDVGQCEMCGLPR